MSLTVVEILIGTTYFGCYCTAHAFVFRSLECPSRIVLGLEGQSTNTARLPLAISDGKHHGKTLQIPQIVKVVNQWSQHRPMRCDLSMRVMRAKEWHTRLNVVEEQGAGAKYHAVLWRGRSDCEIDGMGWLNYSS